MAQILFYDDFVGQIYGFKFSCLEYVLDEGIAVV
jgi:hypothetical protein